MTLLFMYKRFLSRWRCLPSYCKICGRTIHDFSAPDATWEKVEPHIKHGHTLCYDCFCDICGKIGEPTVWRLDANLITPRSVDR